jgi:hypothetical protein
MIQHAHEPTLRGITLLANHPAYALTLERHVTDDGNQYSALCFHGDVTALGINDVAALSTELFALRLSVKEPLFTIENTPDAPQWESYLALFGFKPIMRLPCTDGQERRLFASPAIADAPSR